MTGQVQDKKSKRAFLQRFAKNEVGATSLEYALIATIIGVGLLTFFQGTATKTSENFSNVASKLEDPNSN